MLRGICYYTLKVIVGKQNPEHCTNFRWFYVRVMGSKMSLNGPYFQTRTWRLLSQTRRISGDLSWFGRKVMSHYLMPLHLSRPWTKVAVEIVWVQVNSLNDTLLDFVYLSFFWRGGRGSWNLVWTHSYILSWHEASRGNLVSLNRWSRVQGMRPYCGCVPLHNHLWLLDQLKSGLI